MRVELSLETLTPFLSKVNDDGIRTPSRLRSALEPGYYSLSCRPFHHSPRYSILVYPYLTMPFRGLLNFMGLTFVEISLDRYGWTGTGGPVRVWRRVCSRAGTSWAMDNYHVYSSGSRKVQSIGQSVDLLRRNFEWSVGVISVGVECRPWLNWELLPSSFVSVARPRAVLDRTSDRSSAAISLPPAKILVTIYVRHTSNRIDNNTTDRRILTLSIEGSNGSIVERIYCHWIIHVMPLGATYYIYLPTVEPYLQR